MRGKVLNLIDQAERERITPAYAGKSSVKEIVVPEDLDHPRVCGEKCLLL